MLSVSASADAESRTVTTVARRLRLGSVEGASVDASAASASAAAAAARAALEESDAALAAALQAHEDEAAAAAAAAAASSPLAVLLGGVGGDNAAQLQQLLNLMSVQAGAQPQLQVPAVRLVINGGGPVPLVQMSPIALLAAALGGAGPGFAFGAGGLGGADLTYEQLLALQARMGGAVPRGTSESQLAAIPVHGYVRRGAEAETCSVCLSELEEGQQVRTMPCGHCYHSGSCIDPWLRTSQACPCCRAELPS